MFSIPHLLYVISRCYLVENSTFKKYITITNTNEKKIQDKHNNGLIFIKVCVFLSN